MSDAANQPPVVPLSDAASATSALTDLLAATRRQLFLYSPLVPTALFARPEVADALRRLIVEQPRVQVRMLLPPVRDWRADCPTLAGLIDRLGALELRIPPRDDTDSQAEQHYGFVVADQRNLLVLTDPRRCIGYRGSGGIRARELLNLFNALWERSQPDRELRKLGI